MNSKPGRCKQRQLLLRGTMVLACSIAAFASDDKSTNGQDKSLCANAQEVYDQLKQLHDDYTDKRTRCEELQKRHNDLEEREMDRDRLGFLYLGGFHRLQSAKNECIKIHKMPAENLTAQEYQTLLSALKDTVNLIENMTLELEEAIETLEEKYSSEASEDAEWVNDEAKEAYMKLKEYIDNPDDVDDAFPQVKRDYDQQFKKMFDLYETLSEYKEANYSSRKDFDIYFGFIVISQINALREGRLERGSIRSFVPSYYKFNPLNFVFWLPAKNKSAEEYEERLSKLKQFLSLKSIIRDIKNATKELEILTKHLEKMKDDINKKNRRRLGMIEIISWDNFISLAALILFLLCVFVTGRFISACKRRTSVPEAKRAPLSVAESML